MRPLRFNSLTLSLALLAAPSLVPALDAQDFTGGVRADLAIASLQNDEGENSPRLGLRAGVFGDLELGGPLSVRTEVVYAMKGAKTEGGATIELDYIEVPIVAKIAPGWGRGLFFLAGPAMDIKVSSRFSSRATTFDYGDSVPTLDFGLVGAVGFGAVLGRVPVSFDVRYTRGMGAVFTFGPDDSDSDDRNQVVSAGLGVVLF